MGFALEAQKEKLQEREIKGQHHKVAVGCWFTAKGRAIPQMLKYEDEEGMRHTVEHIQVRKTEQKHFAGILMQRYDCCAVVNGVNREFLLLYHLGENTWDMVWVDENFSKG